MQLASERLQKMGPMSRDEKIMLGTMGCAVLLWVSWWGMYTPVP